MAKTESLEVRREPAEPPHEGRYVIRLGEGVEAELLYSRLDAATVSADRTFTPPAARGKGLADKLVVALVNDARRDGFRIRPACSYVARWFDLHPEAVDLRAS